MFGQSLLSAFGIACTTDTDQLFIDELKAYTEATYQFNSNPDSLEIAGKFGGCGVFNGSTSIISTGLNTGNNNMTFSAWVNLTAASSYQYGLVMSGISHYYTYLAVGQNGKVWVSNDQQVAGDAASGYATEGTTVLQEGTWYHIAATLSSTDGAKIYVNGVLEKTQAARTSNAPAVNNGVSGLGSWYSTSSGNLSAQFNGKIDQVRMFTTVLNDSQISDLANETTSTVSTLNYPTTAIALYQLNGNATDTSGTYNGTPSNIIWEYDGTATNITYAPGKIGNAAVFNGSSSAVEFPSMGTIFQNDYTLSAWFKIDAYGGSGSPGYNLGTVVTTFTDYYGWVAVSSTTNKLRFYTEYLSQAPWGYAIESTTTIELGTWYHMVATKSSTEGMKLYINGVLENTEAAATQNLRSMSSTTTYVNAFGSYGSVNATMYSVLNGAVDQARIFSAPLSQGAVTALYNETATTAAYNYLDYEQGNSVAYYKMENAADQLGNYNGTATAVDFNTEGKFGFAGAFNGSSSIMNLGDHTVFSPSVNPLSVSCWIKTTSTIDFIFSKGGSGAYEYGLFIDGSGQIALQAYTLSASSNVSINTSSAYNDGNWHHVVAIYDPSGNFKIYVDGTQQATSSSSLSMGNSSNALIFGKKYDTSSDFYNGSLDQIRIFDQVLTATEVSTLAGEVYCYTPIVGTNFHNTALYTGNATSNSVSIGFDAGLTWIKNRGASAYHILFDTVRGLNEVIHSDNLLAQQGSSMANSYSNGTLSFSGSPTWGNKLNNTYVAWAWKAGEMLSTSASFNGSSSYVNWGSNNTAGINNNNITLSAWVNLNNYNSTLNALSTVITTQGNYYYYMSIAGSNVSAYHPVGRVVVSNDQVVSGDPSSGYSTESETAVPVQTWTHIAVTFSSTDGCKIYINGVLDKTQPARTSNAGSTGGYSLIGAYNSSSTYQNYFDGTIAQVRAYNGVLDATQMLQLYNETASTINVLNYPTGAGCITAYPLETNADDAGGTNNASATNVGFGKPGFLNGTNTDGTIPSQVSANPNGGFSIVKYIGNGSSSATVGHGLGIRPELTIFKQLGSGGTSGGYWNAYYTPNNTVGFLNESNAFSANSGGTNGSVDIANMDSTKFGFLNGSSSVNNQNNNGLEFIVYCFASIPGYSRVGSYIGQTAGITIYTGFQPRFIMVKSTSNVENWAILDAVRGSGKCLNPNLANAESDSTLNTFTTTATGFSFPHQNTADAMLNENGYEYIFLAIA